MLAVALAMWCRITTWLLKKGGDLEGA